MKKLISLCLLATLIFSLCASSASALTPEELVEKYALLIDALEAGDRKAAVDAYAGYQPELEYEPVDLTEENFFDYFEISTGEPHVEKKSSGKIDYIYPSSLYVSLKEEYNRLIDWQNSTASFGVQAKKTPYRAKIDFETGTVKLGDKASDDVRKAIKKLDWYESKIDTFVDLARNGSLYSSGYIGGDAFYFKNKASWGSYWTNGAAEPDTGYKYYQIVYSDYKISNVSGTLYIGSPKAEG